MGDLRFRLSRAVEATGASDIVSGSYDPDTSMLHIPRIYVQGGFFDVVLKNTGEWKFGLHSAELLEQDLGSE